MYIEKVCVYNWMAHEQKELSFTKGKNVVFGRNASGKSSIAKAIAFALTDILPRDSDPRRDNKKEAIVDVNISFDNGEKYLIRRQLAKGRRLSKRGDLFIYKPEKPSEALFTGEQAKQFLQERIELSHDIFHRVIYMKEEDVHEFLARPNNAVIKEIDRLIGLEKANETSRKIDLLLSHLFGERSALMKQRKKVESGIEVKIGLEIKTRNQKKIEEELTALKMKMDDLQQLAYFHEQKERLGQKLEQLKKGIGAETTKEFKPQIIQKLITKKEEERKKKEEEEKKILDAFKTIDTEEKKKEATLELKDAIVSSLLIEEKEEGKILACPTCNRPMDEKLTSEVIRRLQGEVESLQNDLSQLKKSLRKKRAELQQSRSALEAIDRRIQRYNEMKKELTEILNQLQPIESMMKQLEQKNYPKTMAAIEKALEELTTREEELLEQKATAKAAKQLSEKEVQKLRKEEEEIKHKEKLCKLIREAIDETKRKLRIEFTNAIKNVAEEVWSKYKGERWTIDWDENFVPKAKPENAERFLKAYELSGSERFLMLLAIRIAIQKSLEQFNLLIIDEPCQHLDTVNGQNFRDILTAIEREAINQCIVFTYNENFLEGNWENKINLMAER